MWDLEEEPTEPFRVTPGFIAFVSAFIVPIVVFAVLYMGAWAVSGEVYAADAAATAPESGVTTAAASDEDVAGWKRGLVFVCPLH